MPTRTTRLKLALVAALALALPGCQLWNGWLDMLKWRGPGLDTPANLQFPTAHSVPTPGAVNPALQRVAVYTITLPVGTFSANDKAWAQLNEDAFDSKTAVLMAQNGLRAAIGPTARWPIIKSLIDAPGAAVTQGFCETSGRASVSIVTHPEIPEEIVVTIDRDLQQQGRSFERCDNGFRLSMVAARGKPQLVIQLEPVVTLGTFNVIRSGAALGPSGTGFSSEESFPDLDIAASLTPEQFLVISPVDPRSSRFSVGTLWLSDIDRVPATETILVFVPATAIPTNPATK